jgi:hypothetical protein
LLGRTPPTGYRDHVRITLDPKAARLDITIEGENLRWREEVTAPPRQSLLVSERTECLDGWVAFPAWISSGERGNGESGVTKGQSILRFTVASDNCLVVRDDLDFQTTFFPLST